MTDIPAHIRYSHAVRKRAIQAAVMLLQKSGCMVTETTDRDETVLLICNPPDNADKCGAMAKHVLYQGDTLG